MADLMLASSTYALGTNDTASTITNNVTATDAQQMNGVASGVVAIETILGSGTTLKGSLSDLATRLAVSLAADGTLNLDNFLYETGDICASFRSSKTGWLLMDNTERSNTTYEDLLDQIISNLSTTSTHALKVGTATGTPTADSGTDTFTLASHGLGNNTVVYFTNSGGALPTGISALTKYYIINTATNTFQVSTTSGGAAVNFTTNGTGTHSVYSTFKVDGRGMSPLGKDNMGGTSANKATDTAADNLGQAGGSESGVATHGHTLTDSGHTHPENVVDTSGAIQNWKRATGSPVAATGYSVTTYTGTTQQAEISTDSATTGISLANAGTSTGNMHPYFTVNYFIKT